MKKILFLLFISFCMLGSAKAAGASISVTSNKSQIIVGENVTITVKISSSEYLGSWRFDVVPSSNLSLVSSTPGGLYVVDSVDSLTQKSKTYTFTFKAKSSGTGSVAIKNSTVYSLNENLLTPTNGSVSFKMMTQAQLYATYSKNNYLSSLKIAGYDINFNKDTLTYNLEVENDVRSIDISATKEDSKSTIKGTGKINLEEGINSIKVTVTAQNGDVRTYNINVNVKELKPIEVNIDGNVYTVIRKSELLPKASISYQSKTILIDEEEVPAYYNEISNITLVGLNLAGEYKLYIYDNGKYLNYDELGFNSVSIMPLSLPKMSEEYMLTKIDIGTYSVAAYTKENYPYSIIYGMNIETGKKDFYSYDSIENTIQLYKEIKIENKESLYFIIILVLFGFIIISYITFICIMISKNKKIKNVKKNLNDEL